MLTILHGENTTASRNALHETLEKLRAKSPDAEVLHLDGTKITETELIEALESPSMLASSSLSLKRSSRGRSGSEEPSGSKRLSPEGTEGLSAAEGFSPDRIIHIDNLLSRRPSKEKEKLIEKIYYNQSGRSDYNTFLSLFLWESRQLTPSVIKKFQSLKNCKIQEFKLSKTLFAFLDSLAPKNGVTMTALLASTLKTEAPELVMFMLVRRITELLLATSHDSHALDGVRTPWQRSQLSRQSENWTESELLAFHRKLLEIDEAIKTGSTASDAATHLDILILSL